MFYGILRFQLAFWGLLRGEGAIGNDLESSHTVAKEP